MMSMQVPFYRESDASGREESPDNSLLLTNLQSYDWAGALARIAVFPFETKVVGMQGRTPLHVACDHDAPAVVIQALLKAYPEASAMVGTTDMNPLHITCSSQHASVQVVRVLLELGRQEQTSMRDIDGDTPLHAACRCGAPIEVLEVLLRANPQVVHERDYEGLTPLLRLWVRYFVILGVDVIEGVRGPADLTGELGEAWKKTEMLLWCAHHGSLNQGENFKFRAVHAAAAVDCPRPVVKIAAIVYPRQLDEKDENGMTPLMLAAQAPIFKVRDLSDEGYTLEDVIHGDETDEVNNEESQETEGQSSVIEILLQANLDCASSAAGVPNPQGQLPLHLALATGKRWKDGVKHLIEVFPESLTIPDPACGLYPFMVASEAEMGDQSTTYELLRLNPSLLGDLLSRRNKKRSHC